MLATAALAIILLVSSAKTRADDLYDLSLRELGNLKRSTGAALTRTETRNTPASVTLITRDMIRSSNARSLDELVELYVPNLIRLDVAGGAGPKVGLRGIIGGRNHKTLLLVNGRVMNQRTIFGAISERFLPLLGDIEAIEVVRGPGSAVYGPGAINGVISIRTTSGSNRPGTEASFRQGAVEGYTLGEIRSAIPIGGSAGILAYYGIADYRGADAGDSPLVFSVTRRFGGQDLFVAGVPIDSGIVAHQQSMEERLHQKAHLEIERGGTRVWARLLRGGTHYLPARSTIESRRALEGSVMGLSYQQLSFQADQTFSVGRSLDLQLRAGYDVHDVIKMDVNVVPGSDYAAAMREDEFNLRALALWTASTRHSLAGGVEFAREWFGRGTWTLSDDPSHNNRTNLDPWETNLSSLLAEYQWNVTSRWTAFLGGRADDHSFTTWMWSPKAAIVFSPTSSTTTKLLYNRSVRKSDDIELYLQHEADPDFDGEVERIESVELRTDTGWRGTNFAISAFLQDVDIIGWVGPPRNRTRPIGEEKIFGLEAEARYRGDRHDVSGSFAFTKLRDFTLLDDAIRNQTETSAPYGYGNDLHHWPRFIGKVNWTWQVTPHLRWIHSLRVFWGFEGAENYADYNNEELRQNSLTRTDDGRVEAFSGNALYSSGIEYRMQRGFRVSLSAHNAFGWVRPDLNKRNFFGRMAGYRSEAPAATFRLSYSR